MARQLHRLSPRAAITTSVAGRYADGGGLYLVVSHTGSRKWGRPYLTRAFFDCLQQTMRDDILLEGGPEALARHDRRIAALKQRLTA